MLQITRGITLHIDPAARILRTGHSNDWNLTQVPVTAWLTYEGPCRSDTGMVVNVNQINEILQKELLRQTSKLRNALEVIQWIWTLMCEIFPNCSLSRLAMDIHESLQIAKCREEPEMIQITTKYELAASHRLWNSDWDEKRNRQEFGKCCNPAGHGHNYTLEITLIGKPDHQTGKIVNLEKVDQTVKKLVLEPFDHKNLNEDTHEFAQLTPTVENLARVFWDKLVGRFGNATLKHIRIWETSKTYAEYCGPDE